MEGSASPTALERIKKGFVAFGASLGEGLGYAKASVVGFIKKLRANSEREATAADMQAAKMQVAAADHAEDVKKSLNH